MSRIVSRRIFWEDVAEADSYALYVGNANIASAEFLAAVDAGQIDPVAEPDGASYVLNADALPEGNYQFAVCAQDTAGNFSDPFQAASWRNVPLDLTAPPAPTSGGIQALPFGT